VATVSEWTTDMSIVLGAGTTAELVDFIIAAGLAGTDPQQTHADIQARYKISPADAELAIDRTYGGVFRAKTRNAQNKPDRTDDPIAFESYERAQRDAAIIRKLYP
jgi:hypothetical protein